MIAVVTGASSGMGAGFCRALDRLGLDGIWLIARRADRLEQVAAGLETPSRVFSLDLTSRDDIDSLRRELSESRPEISHLVNCAGFGRFGKSWEIPPEESRSMIDLNVTALTEVTHMCIPYMSDGSAVIELCSASAYMPLEELNVYASTKAFVRSYCGGLRRELAPRGIRVLEVSPGWVDTDFIGLCRSEHDVPEKVFGHLLKQEDVVSKAMSDLEKGRKRSVAGGFYRLQVCLTAHFPGLGQYFWSRMLR